MIPIDSDNIEIISVSVFISFLVSITMGSMLSMFRKPELKTADQLELLENNLKTEKTRKDRVRVQKGQINRSFWFYGIAVFGVLIAGLYLMFPAEPIANLLLTIGLILGVFVVYPVIFFLTRKVCKHYLDREFKAAEDLIKKFEKEKKEILETVMEKEPYNKAKEILKKYDPSLLRGHDEQKSNNDPNTPNVRKRNVGQNSDQNLVQQRASSTGTRLPEPKANLNATMPIRPTSPMSQATPPVFSSPQTVFARKKTVRPLPGTTNNQTKMDKIVGWVTGTNPEQMYALICRNCCEHNGLSVREEFEFLEWRCAYCHFLHKARKQRPLAPRLPEQRPSVAPRSSSVSSDSRRSQSSSPKSPRVDRSPSMSSSESSNARNIREDSGTESDQMESKIEEIEPAPVAEEEEEAPPEVNSRSGSEDEDNATIEHINHSDGELQKSDL